MTEGILMDKDTWKRNTLDVNIFFIRGGSLILKHASRNPYITNTVEDHAHHLWNHFAKHIFIQLSSNDVFGQTNNYYALKKTKYLLLVDFTVEGARFHTYIPSKNNAREILATLKSVKTSKINLFPERYDDFNDTTLRLATFEHPPSVMYSYDEDHNIVKRLGVDIRMVEALARVLNFRIHYLDIIRDELWGHQLRNGTWVGIMGDLVYENADIGAVNIFVETTRIEIVEFTYPFTAEEGCFAAHSAKSLPRWTSPILPFSSTVWASFGVSFLLGTVMLYLISLGSVKVESIRYTSLSFDLLYILGFFTMRSPSTTPKFHPLRMYLGFFWMFATLITIAYSANLVAFLSITQNTPPIKTLKQLRESSLRLGGTEFWVTQFLPSIDENVRSFAERLEPTYEISDLFDKVEAGEYTVIENRHNLEFYIAAKYTYGKKASIRIVDQCLVSYGISVVLQKYSPMAESFNKVILRIVESGLEERWKTEVNEEFRKRSYKEGRIRKLAGDQTTKPLAIDHLLGVFMVFLLGAVVAIWIFLAELLMHRNYGRK